MGAEACARQLISSAPIDVLVQPIAGRRKQLLRPEEYYDLFRPLCRHIDIWHIHYNHLMENHAGVVEWFKGSGLRPLLAPLDADVRETFLSPRLSAASRREGDAEVSALIYCRGAWDRGINSGISEGIAWVFVSAGSGTSAST